MEHGDDARHFTLLPWLCSCQIPLPSYKWIKKKFQHGLDLSKLETSYVSNFSWYFLVMFGLRAFFHLAIGDPIPDTLDSTINQQDLGITEGPAPVISQQFVVPKALMTVVDNLELVQQRDVVDEADKWLLGER